MFSFDRTLKGRFINTLYSGFDLYADQQDWLEYLHELFAKSYNLHALSSAITKANQYCNQVDVWIVLPYPDINDSKFGLVNRKALNFKQGEDRFFAVQWWMNQFLSCWQKTGLGNNLVLKGFCWSKETLLDYDIDLVKQTAQHIHQHQLQFIWTTNYGAIHVLEWGQMGFDLTFLHPNYYGNGVYHGEWIDYTAEFAAKTHCDYNSSTEKA